MNCSSTIAVPAPRAREYETGKRKNVLAKISGSASLILITLMFAAGTIFALVTGIPVKEVMSGYSYDVLVILIVMELFTNLIAQTGIMQFLAIRIARMSGGRKRLCLMMFGAMMFIISSCLNNITAVMMVLPIVFVLFKTLDVDRRYVSLFFAAILALSNTGGAASPVGDFPAICIMSSGITTFLDYLTHAFPLFTLTSAVLIAVWGMCVRKEKDDGALRKLAVSNLSSQYRNIAIRFDVLKWLGAIFAMMFLAWSFVPQSVIPPEIIAVLGYGAAMVVCSLKKIKVNQLIDMKSVLTIASFLFFAQVVSQTGLLSLLAQFLQNHISDPKLLVMVLMLIASVVAGLFSAGPAAAAMLPAVIELSNGALSAQSDWIAVAYAAAICAGSSLFMWSATAGFILSGKVNSAGIEDNGHKVSWSVPQYFKYGLANYAIQLAIALAVVALVI